MKHRLVLFLMLLAFTKIASAACSKNNISGGVPSPACAVDEFCTDGPATKNIAGLDVYRECWNCVAEFSCTGTTVTQEAYCQELIDQGCTPVSQVCDPDLTCTATYSCLSPDSATTAVMDCGTQSFSLDNMNNDMSYPPSTDFGIAAASLGAINDAAKTMDVGGIACTWDAVANEYVCTGDIMIFTGDPMICRKGDGIIAGSYLNCCKDNGWGTDVGLEQCNADEIQLGYAKQGGLTHYIGRDCTNTILGSCVLHEYKYCVFKSKIGRIIHEQGRPQLGITWGTYSSPNCQGFTQDQLASIDFSLIDFTEFFADAINNIAGSPSAADLGVLINNYASQITGSGCSQFDTACTSQLP